MLAVLLGVALVAGTYVLTDTITKSFDDIFEESLKGTDVSITPRQEVQSDEAPPPAFSAALLARAPGGRRGVRGRLDLLAGAVREAEGRLDRRQLRAQLRVLGAARRGSRPSTTEGRRPRTDARRRSTPRPRTAAT